MYNQSPQGVNTYVYPQQMPANQTYAYQQAVIYQPQVIYPQQNMIQPQMVAQPGQPVYYYTNQPLVATNDLQHTSPVGMQEQPIKIDNPPQHVAVGHPRRCAFIKSKYPREITCGACGKVVTTSTTTAIGQGTWAIGLALFCCGLWPCAFIPCCIPDCMDVVHKCPNCGAEVGRRQFLCDD